MQERDRLDRYATLEACPRAAHVLIQLRSPLDPLQSTCLSASLPASLPACLAPALAPSPAGSPFSFSLLLSLFSRSLFRSLSLRRRLVGLVEQGWARQLVISSDTCRKSQMASHGGRGYTFVLGRTIRELSARGVSASDIDAMTRTNMRSLLVRVPARTARATNGRRPSAAPAAGHAPRDGRCASISAAREHRIHVDSVDCADKRRREANLGTQARTLDQAGSAVLVEVDGLPWWAVSCPFCPIGGMLPPSKPPPEPAHL